ncbi:unnamed protein product [Penicillium bialowiezense]
MNQFASLSQEDASLPIPEMRSVNVTLQSIGTSIELMYPSFDSAIRLSTGESNEQSDSTTNGSSNFALDHQEFRNSLSSEKGRNKNFLRVAKAEVETVSFLFPSVNASRIRICMAAWLAALCDIDDLVEAMCAEDAEASVSRAIGSLKGEEVTPDDLITPLQAYDVVRVIDLFQAHCRKYLSAYEAEDFFAGVAGALEGLVQEQKFRQGLLAKELGQYLVIRAYTIGVSPSLSLLRSEYCPHGNLEKLQAIQIFLNILLGLQNDLIGLERDLESGEDMNAVIVLMKTMGNESQEVTPITILQAVHQAVAYHNDIFRRSLELQQSHMRGENELDPPDKFVANAQLRLAETHLKWCLTSKRYQVSMS